MKIIIMRETVNLLTSRFLAHEIKEYEVGATKITAHDTYMVFEYAPQTELLWT